MKVEIKEGTSKTGFNYIYLEVYITPTYTKRIFLTKSEVELLKLSAK